LSVLQGDEASQAFANLPARLGFAGGKACIARSLLLGSECSLTFYLLGGQTDEFGLRALPRRKIFRLALGFSGKTGCFPLADPDFPRLNEGLPIGLPREDSRIIRCRACPEPV
jgi:hypothetical protein